MTISVGTSIASNTTYAPNFIDQRRTYLAPNREVRIEARSLDGTGFRVVKPMQLVVRCDAADEFIASFPDAGIAIAGDSFNDALAALKSEVVELYEIYKNEAVLGPEPKRQVEVLEAHIAKTGRKQASATRSR